MADQKKLGASPAERKRITSNRISSGLTGKKNNNLKGTMTSSPIKGSANKDLARLEAIKKQQKLNAKNEAAKKATSAKKMFGKGGGGSGPIKRIQEPMLLKDKVRASQSYKGTGTIFTGR